jgi:hypothetical protein
VDLPGEDLIYRYPAIDGPSFGAAVERIAGRP